MDVTSIDQLCQLDITKFAQTPKCIAFNLKRAVRAVSKVYDDFIRETGLKITQFTILIQIGLEPDISINNLAKALTIDRTTLTRNLRVLEKQNFIDIREDRDRRGRKITLTSYGCTSVNETLPLWNKAQYAMINKFGFEIESLITRLDMVTNVALSIKNNT